MNAEEMARMGADVLTLRDLRDTGMSDRAIQHRVRSGRWQRVLPGVIVLHSGPLTQRQWCRAALAYGGPTAVLSHYTAAEFHRLRIRSRAQVEITVTHGRSRRSTEAVVVHQCRYRSASILHDGLPCTNVARTVVDVGCSMTARDDVRALVSDSVQRRLTSVRALLHAAERAPRHGRGFLNATLDEVAAGARSAGEARFLALIRRAALPLPVLNAPIPLGRRLYHADAYWAEFRLIVEIDGAAWHLSAVHWENDLVRQNALQAAGFIVLRFPYARLLRDPGGVIHDIRQVIDRLTAA